MCKTKILVTGGTGFIGNAIFRKLWLDITIDKLEAIIYGTTRNLELASKFPWYKYCDTNQEDSVKRLFLEYQPTHIFHFAANPLTDVRKTGLKNVYQSNLDGTLHLLNYCGEGTKFIFASSATVYNADDLRLGASEDVHLCNPQSIYGATKLAAEAAVQAYTNMGKINSNILRICATVGKESTHGALHDLFQKNKNNDTLEVIGNEPGTIKPYIHVDDVVDISTTIGLSVFNGCYNVANEDSISIQDILDVLNEEVGLKPVKWSGQTWMGDNHIVRLKNNKAFRDFLWVPKLDSKEAVRKTIKDYVVCDDYYSYS